MKVAIYALSDGGNVRYVGRALDPRARLVAHLSERADTPKCRWLAELRAAGRRPEVSLLELVEAPDAGRVELRWIRRLHRRGIPLTNVMGTGMRRRVAVGPVRRRRSAAEVFELTMAHLSVAGAHGVR